MVLGSIEISDNLDVIARPDDLPVFIDCLLEHLSSLKTPSWQVIDWYNLLEDSPTLRALQVTTSRHGWQIHQERLHHCPYIPLPGLETYRLVSTKARHEIRRKMRVSRARMPVLLHRGRQRKPEAEIKSPDLMAQGAGKQAFEVMRSRCTWLCRQPSARMAATGFPGVGGESRRLSQLRLCQPHMGRTRDQLMASTHPAGYCNLPQWASENLAGAPSISCAATRIRPFDGPCPGQMGEDKFELMSATSIGLEMGFMGLCLHEPHFFSLPPAVGVG
jgi:hypothetical protein